MVERRGDPEQAGGAPLPLPFAARRRA